MDIPSDATRLYFVRVRETGAAIGLFWSSWNALTILLPRHIDPASCEVAEIWALAGIVFDDGPKLHEGATAGWASHRVRLSEGLANLLFENGNGELEDLCFEPLHKSPDLAALAAALSDDELIAQWKEFEMFESLEPMLEKQAIRDEIERRGLLDSRRVD